MSRSPYDSLNLGLLTEDESNLVLENRRRLTSGLGIEPSSVVSGHQVHGAALANHSGPPRFGSFTDATPSLPDVDGHVVTGAGTVALVLVADCLPVAMVGPRGAAMLHCGWRGLASGIVEQGAKAVGATHAAIGPGIGPCCYEVGAEVQRAFAGLDGVATGPMLDLAKVTRKLLDAAGVEEVLSAGLCTSCEAGVFFSHRRDRGRTGRQAGLVWLEGEG